MLIRTATTSDWPGIFPIFRAIVAAGDSYAYPEDLTSEQARALWMEEPPGHCVVAVRDEAGGAGGPGSGTPADGEVLGTAKMGPNRSGRGAHIATASFMVDPAIRRTGAGRALGEYLIGWAEEAGFQGIQFNAVVETNTPAVTLWQTLGFEIIGTVPGAFDHITLGPVGLHVMYRSL